MRKNNYTVQNERVRIFREKARAASSTSIFPSKPKKIILSTGGDGGFGNLGDEWLLDAVKARYKKLAKEYRIIILKARPPSVNFDNFEYIQDDMENFKNKNLNIKNIILVHFYGGGYLNSFWMKEKIWLYDYLVDKGFSPKQIYFTGQGLGPLNHSELKKLQKVSGECGFFGLRDKRFIDKVGGQFMFDETVHLTGFRSREPANDLLINFRIAVHVSIDEVKIGKILRQLMKFSHDNRLNVRFFSMVQGVTLNEKKEMERVLKVNGIEKTVRDRPRSYKELMRRVKKSSMVVTTSYHATLAALYIGVPVVAIYGNEYYSHKFKGLSEVLTTPLLNPLNLKGHKKINPNFWTRALKKTDEDIQGKIEAVKLENIKAYRAVESALNVQ